MNEELNKLLSADTDGLLTYEYMANHIDGIDEVLDTLIDRMMTVDRIAASIDKDREHKYIGDLLTLWGDDYQNRVDELNASDNNFRRIYKRLYPTSI